MFLKVWLGEQPELINTKFIMSINKWDKRILLSQILPYYGKRVLKYEMIELLEGSVDNAKSENR